MDLCRAERDSEVWPAGKAYHRTCLFGCMLRIFSQSFFFKFVHTDRFSELSKFINASFFYFSHHTISLLIQAHPSFVQSELASKCISWWPLSHRGKIQAFCCIFLVIDNCHDEKLRHFRPIEQILTTSVWADSSSSAMSHRDKTYRLGSIYRLGRGK